MDTVADVIRSFLGQPDKRIVTWRSQTWATSGVAIIILALIVGLVAGLWSYLFGKLLVLVQELLFVHLGQALRFANRAYVLLIPAIGGLAAGPMIHFWAREAKGHGVPEVMEAVALRGGRIRARVAVVKALASALTIGSGGSAGREGPVVQIGSALGSSLGQCLRLPAEGVKGLVACGAAAGIAATFNTPIAGVMFALEVIAAEMAVPRFAGVVVASVGASVVARALLGDAPAFAVPSYRLTSWMELPLYALLGAAAACLGFGFSRVLYWAEDRFESLNLPGWALPAIGGLAVGMLGIWWPELFGSGYPAIERALHGELLLSSAIALALLKVVATSATLGSGGSGGVFAPSLFMGATFGCAFGLVLSAFNPTIVAGPYAVVAMAATFAAAAHAPLTAMIMVFEMTRDYGLILPLMLATVLATLISQHLGKESIYTLKLKRRGVQLLSTGAEDVLLNVTVGEVMSVDCECIPADWSLSRLEEEFLRTHHHGFPVVDSEGRLVGVVAISDLERKAAESNGASPDLKVRDIATPNPHVAFPDEPVSQALWRMSARDLGRLPVVARHDRGRLLGLLRRQDVMRAYNEATVRRARSRALLRTSGIQPEGQAHFIEGRVRPGSGADGANLAELQLPQEIVVVAVYRGPETLIPRGSLRLQAGDWIVALNKGQAADHLRRLLEAPPPG